jgi:hypothetical protein
VAKLPIDAVADVVTLGEGVDGDASQILRRVEELRRRLDEMGD